MPMVSSGEDNSIWLCVRFDLDFGYEKITVLPIPPHLDIAGKPTGSQVIKDALNRLDEYICPHMRSSDEICYKTLLMKAYHIHRPKHALRQGGNWWPVELINCSCPVEDCETGFSIDISVSGRLNRPATIFKVSRQIKKLDSVLDESWIAMAEKVDSGRLPRRHRTIERIGVCPCACVIL